MQKFKTIGIIAATLSIFAIFVSLLVFKTILSVGSTVYNSSSESAICIVGNGTNRLDSHNLTFGGISANMWNLRPDSIGYTRLCYSSDNGLITVLNYSNVIAAMPSEQIVGYPEIAYGYDSYDQSLGPQTNFLQFPMVLETFNNYGYWSSIKYSLGNVSGKGYDFAYDLFIEAQPSPGVGAKHQEVLIFLNQSANVSGCGSLIGYFKEPTIINGVYANATWSMTNDPTSCFSFRLDSPVAGTKGSVSIRLGDFLSQAVSVLGDPALNQQQLMGIEFGSEFIVPNGNAPFKWNWTIYNYTLYNSTNKLVLVRSNGMK